MLDMVLNFLREQGILVILGLLVAGGIFGQVMASVRFRKLRKGIQSLAVLQTPVKQEVAAMAQKSRRERGGQAAGREERGGNLRILRDTAEGQNTVTPDNVSAGQNGSLRQESPVSQTASSNRDAQVHRETRRGRNASAQADPQDYAQDGSQEVDSQLLYLKQSLDRIAAGRDQKLEEEAGTHRKLTPAEEQIIVDILREYLS